MENTGSTIAHRLGKLLPGANREPKVLAVFSNCQLDCDRLVRHLLRLTANSPAENYPIYVYCLETPLEAYRCARVAVDSDPLRLYRRAQTELASVWVALSATSWNNGARGTLMKIMPLTIPPFRGIVVNENGDYFYLEPSPVTRHFIYRCRQRSLDLAYGAVVLADPIARWFDLGVVWSLRHLRSRLLEDCRQGPARWRAMIRKQIEGFELRVIWPLRHARTRWVDRVQRNLDWCTAVALRQIGQFASHVQPFTYSAFRSLPKGAPAPIDVDPSPAADVRIFRIEQPDNNWERSRVARLVADSQSRFLLFCQPGFDESVDDFLPLFADPRTFAVTRQTGFREWRSIMLPLSPFRPLAPMEASRVAAPFGSAVLVERNKFLHLPLPKTLVFGTAWLELFWRAGAAGWRSFSVGGKKPATQQWTYALEELLFMKHLYRDRDLQRLAPGSPALCRGNIAFRPDLSRPYRGLPRLLVVAPYLPFPPSHGGAVRVYNLCKVLADRLDLIYICLREVEDAVDYEVLHSIFRRVYLVDRDEIHRDPHLPELVTQSESSSMRALIAAVAREEAPDLLQIEWTDMAGYREAAPQIPAVLVEHDVTYTLYRQLAEQDGRPKAQREYRRWLDFETERLRTFEGVFVMSRQDREEAIRAGSSPQRTFVIPNGVDLDRYRALPPPVPGAREILFVGTFGHQPNLIGFDELCRRVMPRVWQRIPDVVLRVVAGHDHERHWRNALRGSAPADSTIPQLDPRIIVHGFVRELAPVYEAAQIVVVPLVLAAGTCIKVMEALACQRAVVSTPVGVRGLDLEPGSDAVICELGDTFADAICELLENPRRRDEIARRGRITAEARFSWNMSARAAFDAYSILIRESRARRARDAEGPAQRIAS